MTSVLSLPNDRHQRPMAMRAERRTLTEADVEAAIDEVDSSGLVALLEDFVHLNRGRRRRLQLRAFLVGAHLCSQMHDERIVLERLTDILYFRISEPLRRGLCIPEYPDNDRGFEAGYAVVAPVQGHGRGDESLPAASQQASHAKRSRCLGRRRRY